MVLEAEKSVLFREVSYFRGVLIEGFHCICIQKQTTEHMLNIYVKDSLSLVAGPP